MPIDPECIKVADLNLRPPLNSIDESHGVQEWGTRIVSNYFKYLIWKLRVMECVLSNGADALLLDVDVLVVSPRFFPSLVGDATHNLVISSDARSGTQLSNDQCPGAEPADHDKAKDWVCAGLMYVQRGSASEWFLQEAQRLMVDYQLTDQDAIQVLLTGHAQVSLPQRDVEQVPSRERSIAYRFGTKTAFNSRKGREQMRAMSPLKPKSVGLNTPMSPKLWRRYRNVSSTMGFSWRTASSEQFLNGPSVARLWQSALSSHAHLVPDSILSVHFNCDTKVQLERDSHGDSFLLRPPSPRGVSGKAGSKKLQ